MWQKAYLWSKKLHKWLMWAVAAIGIYMMFSGYVMHRELEGEYLPALINTVFLRRWHNLLSTWFIVVLGGQTLTGLGMWAGPKMIARQRKVTPQVN